MKNSLFAGLLLASLGWFITDQAQGELVNYVFAIPDSPALTVLVGSVCIISLLLLFTAGTGEKVVDVSQPTNRYSSIDAGDLADLQVKKINLEAELVTVTERAARAEARVTELEAALTDSEARLKKARATEARPAQIEAELCNFLGILQQRGRFIDFLMQDVSSYTNDQVGGAARVVHQGCSEAIREYFKIIPVHTGVEGESVSLDGATYDPVLYKLLGDAAQQPPYTGTILHRGWRTERVTLPRVVQTEQSERAAEVIAPAEIEIRPA